MLPIKPTVTEHLFYKTTCTCGHSNRLENASDILQPICAEIKNELINRQVINIDETSYPLNKTFACLWIFATQCFAFFTISASRSSQIMRSVPGELFDGIIISDRFSAYLKYHKDRTCGLLQLCKDFGKYLSVFI
ncbi:MAG: transposase [Candidatus Brocadia sp.]|nr:transposase [Candidatus Brocadia sp.]